MYCHNCFMKQHLKSDQSIYSKRVIFSCSPIDGADRIDRSGLPGGDEAGEDAEDDGYEHAGKMTGIHLNVMSPSLRPQVPPATIDRTVPEPYTV